MNDDLLQTSEGLIQHKYLQRVCNYKFKNDMSPNLKSSHKPFLIASYPESASQSSQSTPQTMTNSTNSLCSKPLLLGIVYNRYQSSQQIHHFQKAHFLVPLNHARQRQVWGDLTMVSWGPIGENVFSTCANVMQLPQIEKELSLAISRNNMKQHH